MSNSNLDAIKALELSMTLAATVGRLGSGEKVDLRATVRSLDEEGKEVLLATALSILGALVRLGRVTAADFEAAREEDTGAD